MMSNQSLRVGVVLGLVLAAAWAHAKAVQCTELDGYAAEKVASYIDSWKDMHFAFQEFRQCDDGGVAEGFSEADARLMSDHWSNLSDGLAFLRTDPSFKRFVISHLDETDNNADLVKIDRLARTACPAAAKSFCAELHSHLKSSECDPAFPDGVGCTSQDAKPVRKPD
jgi:hypothetical protein